MSAGWNEYDAARHCLEAPSIWPRVEQYVAEQSFDWDSILATATTFSHGEQIIVNAARTFWNTHNDDGVLGAALHTLDESNTRRVIEAALIYCRIPSVENPMVTA